MFTHDISSLYSSLSHNLIKGRFLDLIEQPFKREEKLYLACNDKKCFLELHADGSGFRLYYGPNLKLLISVGLGQNFFICCLAYWGSNGNSLILQIFSGVV